MNSKSEERLFGATYMVAIIVVLLDIFYWRPYELFY